MSVLCKGVLCPQCRDRFLGAIREAFFASGEVRSLHPPSRTLLVSEKPRVQGSSRNLERPIGQCQNLISPPSHFLDYPLAVHNQPAKRVLASHSRWIHPPAKASLRDLIHREGISLRLISSSSCSQATRKAGFVFPQPVDSSTGEGKD